MNIEAYVRLGCGTIRIEVEVADDADEMEIYDEAYNEIMAELQCGKLDMWRKLS